MTHEAPASASDALVWSCVEDGFFVATRGESLIGYVDRVDPESFQVCDARSHPLGYFVDFEAARSCLETSEGETLRWGEGSAGLFRLIYSSDATGTVDEPMLLDILEGARAKNAALDITGILLYRGGRFVQYLEGPEVAVRALFAEICADSRHERVRLLYADAAPQRRFSSWTMGFEPITAPEAPIPAECRSTFDDIEQVDHPEQVLRAMSELTLWFHSRNAQH